MCLSADPRELPVQVKATALADVPKLVIFDCDGVLVQSEEITLSVLIDMLNTQGNTCLDATRFIENFRGRKIADCLREAEQLLNVRLDTHFEQRFRQQALAALTLDLAATDGVIEVLQALTVPYCVASSAPREKIEHCLRQVGLFSYFEGRIFSCYELGRWKPDPLVFLTACDHHNVDVSEALVVEDSVTGIQAAIAANIPVLGLGPPHRHPQLAAAGARPIIDIREMLAIFNLSQ